MMAYRWPGNVRELENVVRRLLVLRDADMLARELLAKAGRRRARPALVAITEGTAVPEETEASPILEQVIRAKDRAETEAILTALHSTRWNRKLAAALLEIDYKALLYKMKKLGVEHQPIRFSEYADSNPKSAMAASGASY